MELEQLEQGLQDEEGRHAAIKHKSAAHVRFNRRTRSTSSFGKSVALPSRQGERSSAGSSLAFEVPRQRESFDTGAGCRLGGNEQQPGGPSARAVVMRAKSEPSLSRQTTQGSRVTYGKRRIRSAME